MDNISLNWFKKPWNLGLVAHEKTTFQEKKRHLVEVLRNVRAKGTMEPIGVKRMVSPYERFYIDPFLIRNRRSGIANWNNFERDYFAWQQRRLAKIRNPIEVSDDTEHANEVRNIQRRKKHPLKWKTKSPGIREQPHHLKIVEIEDESENEEFIHSGSKGMGSDCDEDDSESEQYLEEESTSFNSDECSDDSSEESEHSGCDDKIIEAEKKHPREEKDEFENFESSFHCNSSPFSNDSNSSANSTANFSSVFEDKQTLKGLWRHLLNDPMRAYYTLWHFKAIHKVGSKELYPKMKALSQSDRVNASLANPPKGAPNGYIDDVKTLSDRAKRILNLWMVTIERWDDISGEDESPVQLWNSFFPKESYELNTPQDKVSKLAVRSTTRSPLILREAEDEEDVFSPQFRITHDKTPKEKKLHSSTECNLSANESMNNSIQTNDHSKSTCRRSIRKCIHSLADDLAMTPSPSHFHLKGRVSELKKLFEDNMKTPLGRSRRAETGSLRRNYPYFLSDDLRLSLTPSPSRSRVSQSKNRSSISSRLIDESLCTPVLTRESIRRKSRCLSAPVLNFPPHGNQTVKGHSVVRSQVCERGFLSENDVKLLEIGKNRESPRAVGKKINGSGSTCKSSEKHDRQTGDIKDKPSVDDKITPLSLEKTKTRTPKQIAGRTRSSSVSSRQNTNITPVSSNKKTTLGFRDRTSRSLRKATKSASSTSAGRTRSSSVASLRNTKITPVPVNKKTTLASRERTSRTPRQATKPASSTSAGRTGSSSVASLRNTQMTPVSANKKITHACREKASTILKQSARSASSTPKSRTRSSVAYFETTPLSVTKKLSHSTGRCSLKRKADMGSPINIKKKKN